MNWNFEEEANKIHKIEVQSLLDELSVKEEEYCQQARDEGYDNLHDYESDITKGLAKRIIIPIVFILAITAILFLY